MKPFSDSFDAGKGAEGGHDNPGPYTKGIETGKDKKGESVGEPKFSQRVDTGQKVPFE